MSRLEKLIAELCPDGVEFKRLGDVCEIRSGWGFPIVEQGNKSGEYPFYKVGDMNLLGNEHFMTVANNYVNSDVSKKLGCNPAPKGTIIFPKIGAAIATNKKRLLLNSSCYDNNVMGIIPRNDLVPEFLFYLFDSVKLIDFADYSGAMPSIRKSTIEKYRIPVPTMEVQREIVRILDKFSEKSTELCNLLSAELVARKKQYEYYREKLLTFGADVPRVTLGEICSKVNRVKWQDVNVQFKYIDLSSVNRESHDIKETIVIDKDNAPSRAQQIVEENDILFGTTRPLLKRTTYISKDYDGQICSTGFCVIRVYEQRAFSRFVFHLINAKNFYDYVKANEQGTSYPSISDSKVKDFVIPLPPLPEQKRIADILDRFDSRFNDLFVSIPAEIAARKKQYEYYRDRLLTFREKIAEKG